MFKKEMQEKLKAIFGVSKVTFSSPGQSLEQDCIFVEIDNCKANTGQGVASARVSGSISIFSQYEKLPFGFFSKRIQQADPRHTKAFFFFDTDVEKQISPTSAEAPTQNIAERRASFVYLYSAQYDPNQGEITSLVADVEFEEA